MWDYMVLAGQYRLDGADVVIENQKQGRTTLQVFLEFYGREGYELVNTHFTPGWAVVIMKRPRGVVPIASAAGATAFGAGQPAAPAAPVLVDEEGQVVRRRKPAAAGQTARRRRADLDRLYREE